MKVVFMGTPDFAIDCFEKLIEDGHEILLAVTQPDKPVGRKYVLTPPPIKVIAEKHNIPVYQPEKIKNNPEAIEKLFRLGADVFIVVAYGKILPQELLDIPKYGCINVHASLLPKYRGAGPIQWAILKGEKKTGVTTMLLDIGMDTGDMLVRSEVEIPLAMTASQLHDVLAKEGAAALSKTLKLLKKDEIKPEKQDDDKATYAPMLSRKLSPIDWTKTAFEIHNKIRGLNSWPSATTKLEGKRMKIHISSLTGKEYIGKKSGEIVSASPFTVACGDGLGLEVVVIQLDGGRKMKSSEFMLGRDIKIGSLLTN